MKRTALVSILVLFATAAVSAEEPKAADPALAGQAVAKSTGTTDGGIAQWLRNLRDGLENKEVQKFSDRNVSAVAAVRGAEQKSADPKKPYFKRGTSAQKAEEAEKGAFKAAVDLALAGKTDEALKALEGFEARYPKSALLNDVRETIAKLKPAGETPKVEEQKPEEKKGEEKETGESKPAKMP